MVQFDPPQPDDTDASPFTRLAAHHAKKASDLLKPADPTETDQSRYPVDAAVAQAHALTSIACLGAAMAMDEEALEL